MYRWETPNAFAAWFTVSYFIPYTVTERGGCLIRRLIVFRVRPVDFTQSPIPFDKENFESWTPYYTAKMDFSK